MSNYIDSGYVFAPYVPLQITPVIFDKDDFVPTKGIKTKYGKKLNHSFYGKVSLERKNRFSMDNYLYKILGDEIIQQLEASMGQAI